MSWQSQGFSVGVDLMLASLVRSLGLLVAAWLILRVFRVRHPASRHAVWTAVLVGMLLLPIVSVVTPHWTLPVWPAKEQAVAPTTAPVPSSATAPADSSPVESSTPAVPSVSQADRTVSSSASVWPSTSAVIVWCYAAGLFAMAMYRLIGWALLRRVLARSTPLGPACLRESSDVVTPVAVGVLRPVVILPAGWRHWHSQTRRAVLAHEFAHLRRGDTRVAALARFVRCLFWFHPMAWWVSRQTSDLAELACDAVALQRVGDPARYSRVLVQFAAAVRGSGQRVALPGLAMASASRMNDRVDQVFKMSDGTMRKLSRPRVWLLAIGLPALCLSATVVVGARAPLPSRSAPDAGVPTGPPSASQTVRQDGPTLPTQAVKPAPLGTTQSRVAPPLSPKFEVVSIKPCDVTAPTGSGRGGAGANHLTISRGFVYWSCVPLSDLIDQAWGGGSFPNNSLLNTIRVPPNSRPDAPKRVRGGPAWVEEDRFTIEVRLSGDATDLTGPARHDLVQNAMGPALRAMIEDRFQLKLRKATEQQPMYALTVAKGGLKITQTAPARCWERDRNGLPDQATPPPGFEGTLSCDYGMHGARNRGNWVWDVTNIHLTGLANWLSQRMDRYVLDKTSVEGRFSFKLEYAPDDSTPGDIQNARRSAEAFAGLRAEAGQPAREPVQPDGPTIFKALELLGLKLEPTRGPAEYLLIESVQRPRPDSPTSLSELRRGPAAARSAKAGAQGAGGLR